MTIRRLTASTPWPATTRPCVPTIFDDYFTEVTHDGIRQVVILAAGLDSRAFRLDWPAGTTVYEIDQPKVLEYKTATLQAHGAVSRARHVPVPIDLRDDWPAALIAAGFDPAQPTAWLAEGLLPYLPGEAQDRLFDIVSSHSAPGSRLAVEDFAMDPARYTPEKRPRAEARGEHMRISLGLDIDADALMYTGDDRADAAEWLAAHGWDVDAVDSAEEMAPVGPAGTRRRIGRTRFGQRAVARPIGWRIPMSSLRSHDDTWDIATSVGWTGPSWWPPPAPGRPDVRTH